MVGVQILHGSTRSVEQAARELAIVSRIDHSTLSEILRAADLPPHRFRYWTTTVGDDEAIARTVKILWYYERLGSLWPRGEVGMALDEKPSIPVLERAAATQPLAAGRIERQEVEYRRHGIVNWLVGLSLYNGRMWGEGLDKNEGAPFRPAVRRLLHPY
jgi:hypothetical protein